MEQMLPYLKAFIVGGMLCVIGEILLLETKLTTSRILVLFVVSGVVLTAVGLYKPIVDFAGAGATVPLTGFGYSLADGAIQGAQKAGWAGAVTGALSATSAGITTAIVFGLLNALIFKPKMKS